MIIAGTGHRPPKLGGYSTDVLRRLVTFATDHLDFHRPTRVISGMALGWDTALAIAATRLEIPWTAAIPFPAQPDRWPESSRARYHKLLDRAADVVTLADTYSPQAMQTRNEWMVDHADQVWALWNGTPGGTSNCLTYAARTARPVVNLWDLWQLF